MDIFKYLCPLMKTIYLNQLTETCPDSVATIGVFDGVHLGHQLVIKKVQETAKQNGLVSMVVTFDRPPRQLFDPSFRPQMLTTLEEKEAIIASLGVDYLVVLPFTRELAGLSARDFMSQVLSERLNVRVLYTGYDNRFGCRKNVHLPHGEMREESFDDYVGYGKQLGMEVLRGDVELMDGGNIAVSSSVIRDMLIHEGRVDLMPHYLTRRYALQGRVVPGEHIGHQLGYPTANIELTDADKLIPASGVYAVWVKLEGEQKPWAAMMNIGRRPTFDGHCQTLEVNILDFDGNLYGQTVCITFVRRLREERKFESPEALVQQLREDKEQVTKLLI